MKIQDFDFPVVTGLDIAFPTVDTNKELLKEAEERGFNDWNNPYHKVFATLFFDGGKVKFKEGLDEEFKNKAWAYCRALMGSFAPKHEHKAAVCALIMSELLEPTLQPA